MLVETIVIQSSLYLEGDGPTVTRYKNLRIMYIVLGKRVLVALVV